MSENLIPYWEKWIEGNEDIDITEDGYILRYYMVNEFSSDGVKDWVCCTTKKKLFAFIKYILLPSIAISKTIGIQYKEVYFDVANYEETINILSKANLTSCKRGIRHYNKWFDEISTLEEEDADFELIKSFLENLCIEVEYKEALYLEVDLFRNIKCVGRELIEEYEHDNMLDVLEDIMELKKCEIINLFENINNNKFMLKKIMTLLNEKI